MKLPAKVHTWTFAGSCFLAAHVGFGQTANSSASPQACQTAAKPAEMVEIAASGFLMGDALGEGPTNELPSHAVFVGSFWIETNLVSRGKWDSVYQWAVARGYRFSSQGDGKAREHPICKVNWYDAVKWCNARSEKDSRPLGYYTDAALKTPYRTGEIVPFVNWKTGYRLPTEAEWEKASRGGLVGKRFPCGDKVCHSDANYYSSSDCSYDTFTERGYHPSYKDGVVPYTSPVGTFAPNAFGICDVAGNVRQWCWDYYEPTYYAHSPSADPRGPATGKTRVVRGGAWFLSAANCRVSCRGSSEPTAAVNGIGFRCAMTASE